MQFSVLYAVASLVATVIAQSSGPNQFNNPQGGYKLTAGKPTTLTWDPSTSGTVTLTLRSGASSNLDEGVVLASSIPNSGSATITPPADTVRNSDYTIEISSDSDPKAVNYTPQLVIESTNTVESISAMSGSASSAATSAASASASSAASASATSASAASASSASASGSASSARSASSASTASASGSMTTGSATRSATSSRSTQSSTGSAESAPTSGASSLNRFNVQGGLAVAALGAAVLL